MVGRHDDCWVGGQQIRQKRRLTTTGGSIDFDATDTLLAYVTTRVPQTHPDDSVADIIRQLGQGVAYDSMVDIAVIETGRLVGLISIERVFTASPETLASSIMDPEPPIVGPGVDLSAAATAAAGHEESSLGVIDAHGAFLGLIPPHRIPSTRRARSKVQPTHAPRDQSPLS